MNIAVVGCGYVGLTVSVCLAEMGNNVTCVDVDLDKIESLRKGIVLAYEPGIDTLLNKNINKTLFFSNALKEVCSKVDIIFIAVGTPMSVDGSADLSQVEEVAINIGKYITKEIIVVNKSTVPVGTGFFVKDIIKTQLHKRNENIPFHIVSNPEFLKEGSAINDFMKPDRVVIGAESELAFSKMKQIYASFFRTHNRFIEMDIKSAEMTKYASNAMLATKISFINEVANICDVVGADVNKVRVGLGSDTRIGYNFLYPGVGYGGSCFPKDINALSKTALDNGYTPHLVKSVQEINEFQKTQLVNKILNRFNNKLEGMTFAIWGVAFKPGTDDVREAPSISIISRLLDEGTKVKIYDPKAMQNFKKLKAFVKFKKSLSFYDNKYDVLKNSDALLLLTEWKEFRSPDFNEIKERLNNPIIFDGRNQYHQYELHKLGFEIYQIGNTQIP